MTAYTPREIEALRQIAVKTGKDEETENGISFTALSLESAIGEMEKRGYGPSFYYVNGAIECCAGGPRGAVESDGSTHREAAILCLLQIIQEEA